VLVIDSDVPTAFTSGLLRPTCYISQGLIDNLSTAELNIVIEHELAHARNKDPLFMLLIACLSAYYPKKLALLLNGKYRLMTEHAADQSAALKHSAEDVAATILKVVKLQKLLPAKNSNSYLSYFGAHDITQRIQQLLKPTKKSISTVIPVVTMLIMLCLTVVAVDATHHLVESVFTHS
jgi:Zn-dependent protease with chaperone function